jgi:beta-lactam-binding protein with PASTA domain
MPAKKIFEYSQLLLLFFIIFFLSAILFSRIIQKGEMVSVPDLTGKTPIEARSELAKRKLSLFEKGVEFSDRWERGRIILQDPSAGSKIRVSKAVKVVLSGGSEMVEVPKLVGRSLEASAKILVESGLERGKVSQIHTSQYAAGRIIAQEPSPSAQKVKRSTPINLLVSQGEVESKYLMPDLIGKKAGPTIARLKELGFQVADIRYSFYPGLDPGIIIKQFPAHGYGIAKRNLIALEVSR